MIYTHTKIILQFKTEVFGILLCSGVTIITCSYNSVTLEDTQRFKHLYTEHGSCCFLIKVWAEKQFQQLRVCSAPAEGEFSPQH